MLSNPRRGSTGTPSVAFGDTPPMGEEMSLRSLGDPGATVGVRHM